MPSFWSYLRDETYADWLTIGHMPPHVYPFAGGSGKLLDKQYAQDGLASLLATPGLILLYLSWNIAHTLPIGNTYRYAFPQYALEYSKKNSVAEHGANKLLKKAHEEALTARFREWGLTEPLTTEQVDTYWKAHSVKVTGAFNRLLTAVTTDAIRDHQQMFPALIPNLFDEPGKPRGIMRHYWAAFFQHAYAHYVSWEAMELLPPGTITGWFLNAAESLRDSSDLPLQQRLDSRIWEQAQFSLQDPANTDLRKFAVIWYAIASLRGRSIVSDSQESGTFFYTTSLGSQEAPHGESKLMRCAQRGTLSENTPPDSLSMPDKKSFFSFGKKKPDTQMQELVTQYIQHYRTNPHISLSEYVAAVERGEDAVELAWLHKDYQLTGERLTAGQYKADYGQDPEHNMLVDGYVYVMRRKNDFSGCYRTKPVNNAIVWWAFLPRLIIALLMTAVQVVMLAIQLVVTLLAAIPSALYFYVYEPLKTPEGLCVLSTLSVIVSAGLVGQAYTIWLPPFAAAYQAAVSAIVSVGWSSASVATFIQTSCVVMFVCALAWSEYSFVCLSHVKTTETNASLWRPLVFLCGLGCGALSLYAAILYPGISAFVISPALMAGMGLGIIALAIAGLCLVTLRFMEKAPAIKVARATQPGSVAASASPHYGLQARRSATPCSLGLDSLGR